MAVLSGPNFAEEVARGLPAAAVIACEDGALALQLQEAINSLIFRVYVNPDLPEWLPTLTLRNLRAGRGALELRLERDRVEVLKNTTGFEVVHGRVPRPPLVETPLARR